MRTNLDTKTSPCVSSPDYNFADCVEDKIIDKVGCRPFWIKNIGKKHSDCQNQSQYSDHLTEKNSVITMNEAKLNEKIGCMRSCTYMEYKVDYVLWFPS